ncbi:MAG: imidazolonepropionase, partial [Acidobacteriota bacterium]
DEVLSQFSSANVIDAGGRAVCPSFVDPHTHIVFGGNRLAEFEQKIKGADYLEILAAGGGIISTVRQTREADLAELIDESRGRLDKMLACGTTWCEVKTGYGLDTETEIKMLEAIAALDRDHSVELVPTFLGAHAVPPEFREHTPDYVDLICSEMLPAVWNWYRNSHFPSAGKLIFCDVFAEKNAFDTGQSERILDTARQLGFRLKAHVDEFTNIGASRMAIGLNAASIDHLDQISEGEIALLAASETIGVITPTVNFNFGSSTFANARDLIDAGCAIALSTDYNPGSAPCPSQPMAMAIACRYQRMLPAECLNATTINAASAIGVVGVTGSIEVGKRADLLILNATDHREIMYEFGGGPVGTVISAGEQVWPPAADRP